MRAVKLISQERRINLDILCLFPAAYLMHFIRVALHDSLLQIMFIYNFLSYS